MSGAAHEHFEMLYRSTRGDLLAYLLRRAGTVEEAADLLAETYLIAWQKLERVPGGDEARLWLFGVARNLCLQSHRRRRVSDSVVERLAGELRSAEPPTAHPPRDEALWVALSDLSQTDREIVTLAAWEDLSPREIATVLGMSANAVRIRLHRSRVRLRRRLATDSDPAAGIRPEARRPSPPRPSPASPGPRTCAPPSPSRPG